MQAVAGLHVEISQLLTWASNRNIWRQKAVTTLALWYPAKLRLRPGEATYVRKCSNDLQPTIRSLHVACDFALGSWKFSLLIPCVVGNQFKTVKKKCTIFCLKHLYYNTNTRFSPPSDHHRTVIMVPWRLKHLGSFVLWCNTNTWDSILPIF